MKALSLALLISVVAFTAVGQQKSPEQRPASCPVTLPPEFPFKPPGERFRDLSDNSFGLGTDKLWISLCE